VKGAARMKKPVITAKRVKIGAVALAVFLALLFGLPILGGGWFGQTSTGGPTPGAGYEQQTHP